MNNRLLPLAILFMISMPGMVSAQESRPSGQLPVANQAEQQNKARHNHRQSKRLTSFSQASSGQYTVNTDKGKNMQLHDHRQSMRLTSFSQANADTYTVNESKKKQNHNHRQRKRLTSFSR